MALILIGINHTTATVALREKVAFPPEVVQRALAELCQIDSVNEAVIVSTCNRTELYLGCESDQLQSEKVIDWLARFHGLERQELDTSSYAFEDAEVVRHLMKVSCGLDSMVLGEPPQLNSWKLNLKKVKNRCAYKLQVCDWF